MPSSCAYLSAFDVLILTESAPFVEHAPATGLAVRHTRMAEALSGQGVAVTYAWPESDGNGAPAVGERRAFESLAVRTPADLADWLAGHDPAVVILGYWELAGLLPESADCILVLDYIAPRMLERQFEDGDRLAGEAAALIDLLARCDQVWVGNRRQHDLMLAWLLLAGQDCRYQAPIRIVPIAGPVVGPTVDSGAATDSTASDSDRPLVLFHGGRDWPWRDSTAWISALRRQAGPWRLDDGSEQAGLTGHNRYLERLAAADLVLELSDPNIERCYSQSFRMADALCSGVPVICNGFLPLAAQIEHYRCGWLVDTPDQLAGLLEGIAKDRAELARRAENARRLARDMLDAGRIYTGLAGELAELAAGHRIGPRRPLLALAGALEQRRNYHQIYLARPIVPLSNNDIGYLPGDVNSKIDPYMQPLWDNLSFIKNQFSKSSKKYQKVEQMVENEKLRIIPLAYIRGRSLSNVIFIVDEAQNLTPHEVKTIITRAGENTKIIFTGDIFQIDTPYLDTQSNGLSFLVDRMHDNDLYAHINLEKGERSELANLASKLL